MLRLVALALRPPLQQCLLQCWMHGDRLRGGFRLRALQNAAAPPIVGMLNVKNAVFKIALLPPQSSELPTTNPKRTVQENQQLISEAKLA